MGEKNVKNIAIVHKKDGRPKEGRGFSVEELKKAELTIKSALKLGVPVDSRRRSLHEENVEILKEHLKGIPKPAVKPKKTKD